ncbi:Alpha/Beta hydrolase protein [Amylostereum chailletii]|nr:Alpha/Beta hydrolase protein [Amylostereum chailletii]
MFAYQSGFALKALTSFLALHSLFLPLVLAVVLTTNNTDIHSAASTSSPAFVSVSATQSSITTTTPSATVPSVSNSSTSTNTSSATPSNVIAPPLKQGQLPSSFPANGNITSGADFDTSWQDFFLVTQGLPNITFPLVRNFAGNLPNGPMILNEDFTISSNAKSFTNLVDMFWIDQPVGAGFSTVDSDGYAQDEDEIASDFVGFLSNLVKIFPSLAERPLYLVGEDYSGVYVSYIAKALMASSSPPVKLSKIVIGNGILGGFSTYPNLATVNILESYPQLIDFDQNVFEAFQSKSHLCGYDMNLTYPQTNPLPAIASAPQRSAFWKSTLTEAANSSVMYKRAPKQKRQSPSLGPALDAFYGCALFAEMIDYASNFSSTWDGASGGLDLYDASNVLNPKATLDGGVYFNSLQVRGALHAPFSKNWTSVSTYPFGSTTNTCIHIDLHFCRPAIFFNDLVASAASQNIEIILYSGSKNIVAHHSALEGRHIPFRSAFNTTFGGARGFTRKPSTPWQDDSGNVAGITHRERGIVYALFDNVGDLIPRASPNAAFVFFRDFVLKSSSIGTITVNSDNKAVVLGGEDAANADDIPRIVTELFIGASTTESTIAMPSATAQAWKDFIGNVTVATQADQSNAGTLVGVSARCLAVLCSCLVGWLAL